MKTRIALLLLTLVFIPACAREGDVEHKTVTEDQVKEEANEALKTAGAYFNQEKETYRKKLDEKLEQLNARIDDLKVAAQKGEEVQQSIQELEQQKAKTETKLGELKSRTQSAWQDFKKDWGRFEADLDQKLDNLKQADRKETGNNRSQSI